MQWVPVKLLLVGLAYLGVTTVGVAGPPDGGMSSYGTWDDLGGMYIVPWDSSSLDPHPWAVSIVTIRDSGGNALPGVTVDVVFPQGIEPDVIECAIHEHQQVTNGSGKATFFLVAGGCGVIAGSPIQIEANGTVIKAFDNYASSDWATEADLVVNLADLVKFQREINEGTRCHDYNFDGVVTLGEVIPFGLAFLSLDQGCQ